MWSCEGSSSLRSGGLVSCSGLVSYFPELSVVSFARHRVAGPSFFLWLSRGSACSEARPWVCWLPFSCCSCATVSVSELWRAVYDLFLVFSNGGSSFSPPDLRRVGCLSAAVFHLWCSSMPVRRSYSPALPRWRSFGEAFWS